MSKKKAMRLVPPPRHPSLATSRACEDFIATLHASTACPSWSDLGAEHSESFPGRQTRVQQVGGLEFHVNRRGCGGVAPCCDFVILATPAERAEASGDEA
jgi:hypothetical protein